jgi:hypothetical protein
MAAVVSPAAPTALRVAAVWGTTVVSLRTLTRGESFVLGDGLDAALPIPDGVEMSPTPLRAAQGGWDLDARGALGGLLTLRGRPEDPLALARTGAAVPVMPGDYGLVQYGQFSIFFQYTSQPIVLPSFRGPEVLVLLAFLSSSVLHVGILALIRTLMTPPPLAKPLELTNPEDWAAKFGLHRPMIETAPPPLAGNDNGGPKDDGPKKDEPKGGKAMKGPQGAAGLNGAERTTQLTGERRETTHYGGLSDVLEGETGKEIQNTLKSINSVSAALAGLNSSTIVLGSGPGAGLKGTGPGGGGDGPGVLFGSNLNTGFGFGAGPGGLGGGGGPGGHGKGGHGNGTGSGNGDGRGDGPGERAVTAAPANAPHTGGLSPEQVRRVVMGRIGAVRACYEGEAQKNPGLKGGVTIAWSIEPGGSVTSASLAGTTLNNPRVEGCVLRQVRTWRFPSSDAPTTVAGFPFKFGVGG